MTPVWMMVRADLRARWRSWVVLGLLAGVTFGLVAAGVAGARRVDRIPDRYLAATNVRLDAAILPNDPAFDEETRARIARLPLVEQSIPFLVAFGLQVLEPPLGDAGLVPTTPVGARNFADPLVAGRHPDPRRADEAVIDENVRDRHDLDLGSELVVGQQIPPELLAEIPAGFVPERDDLDFRARVRVVGIQKATSDESTNVSFSSAFYDEYGARLVGPTNMFLQLRGGERRFEQFQASVEREVGRPVNVERGSELMRLRQLRTITGIERDALLLFALAALVGGGVLVGQALVRAVTAGAGDVRTWRALGAGRRTVVLALTVPSVVVGLVGAAVAVAVAVALSPRFPVGGLRDMDLDPGFHVDGLVLALGAFGVLVAALAVAAVTAWWRAERVPGESGRPSVLAEWVSRVWRPPALLIGARLAVEPGRGVRAVPVRSALVGAIVGVLGIVACFTFRAGLDDAVASPSRSGVVWDAAMVSPLGPIDGDVVDAVAGRPEVGRAVHATWVRALPIAGASTPVFGTAPVRGSLPFVVMSGRAPRGPDEIAFAPSTLASVGIAVGDRITVGSVQPRQVRVVGTALLPATSHTGYDQSAWMDGRALARVMADEPPLGPNDLWDFVLVRWRSPVDAAAGFEALQSVAGEWIFVTGPDLPDEVVELGKLRSLPLALAGFFALLGVATVAHALVSTVRRRRHDLAVLRAIGFTGRQTRAAVAWQATFLAVAGVVVGVPLGIIVGRGVWRALAESFPIVYTPPLAVVVVVVVAPAAVLVVNAVAAGPARAASRIPPAEALRVE